MKKLLADPTVRLALRAVVVAAVSALTQIHNSNGAQIAWQSVAIGAALAFAEVFTPLNSVVGFLKFASEKPAVAPAGPPPPVPAAPPAAPPAP